MPRSSDSRSFAKQSLIHSAKFRILGILLILLGILAISMMDKKDSSPNSSEIIQESLPQPQPSSTQPIRQDQIISQPVQTITEEAIPGVLENPTQQPTVPVYMPNPQPTPEQPNRVQPAPTNTQQPTTPNVPTTPTLSNDVKKYSIQQGDILYMVCKKTYGTSSPRYWKALIAYNKENDKQFNPNKLQIGGTILLPPKAVIEKLAGITDKPENKPEGDGIAKRATPKISNPIPHKNYEPKTQEKQPSFATAFVKDEKGQAYYVIQQDDTWEGICKKVMPRSASMNVQEEFIKNFSRTCPNPNRLKTGTHIPIPKALLEIIEKNTMLAKPQH